MGGGGAEGSSGKGGLMHNSGIVTREDIANLASMKIRSDLSDGWGIPAPRAGALAALSRSGQLAEFNTFISASR